MHVEIDPHSGFCGGVIRAIGTAEEIAWVEGLIRGKFGLLNAPEEI